MKISFEVFLVVAENLSITKAAEQLHVTQQCASDHIHRLEEEYRVVLFERRPRLKLTAAGQTLYSSLQSIKVMEVNMERNLMEVSKEIKGTFSVGISTSRAPILLPAILHRYFIEYPHVSVQFDEQDTKPLEEELKAGKLDLFVGVNTTPAPEYEIHEVVREKIVLVISRGLLEQNFSAEEIRAMENGVDLKRFSKIPFTLALNTGKVTHAIQEYLDYNRIQLNIVYYVSDSRTQISISSTGFCAALCPQMLLDRAYEHNRSCSDEKRKLLILPVNNLEHDIRIDLVWRKNIVYPQYIRRFIAIAQEEISKLYKESE